MTSFREVFLDTSALFAVVDSREGGHREAGRALEALVRERRKLSTTDMVIAELHALALRRLGPETALTIADRVIQSPRLEVIASGSERVEAGLAYLHDRPGRRYSLADAVSFGVMRERGIDTAFALDEDFAAEGFQVVPER